MADYTFSPTARNDLVDIWSYVAQRNPDAADRLIDSLYERFSLLARQPLIGETRSDLGAQVRQFSVGNYVIFYVPSDIGIHIARVLHSSRDIPPVFWQTDE